MIDGLILCAAIAAAFLAMSRVGLWVAARRLTARGEDANR